MEGGNHMTNWKLINDVVKSLTEIYEAEHIVETKAAIEKRVIEWYNHTDITDEQMLIAAAWLGTYDPSIKYEEIEDARDALFLEIYIPLEYTEIHIGEIEAAINDSRW